MNDIRGEQTSKQRLEALREEERVIRKETRQRKREILNALIAIKFGTHFGARAQAADALDVARPNFYQMTNGQITCADRHIDVLMAMPDYEGFNVTENRTWIVELTKEEQDHALLMIRTFTKDPNARLTNETLSKLVDLAINNTYHKYKDRIDEWKSGLKDDGIENISLDLEDPLS